MPPTGEAISKVVVHPLVLLSVVDHFNRVSTAGSQKRVVGVLLGANRKGVLDVSNSFAGKHNKLQHFTSYYLKHKNTEIAIKISSPVFCSLDVFVKKT